MTKTDHTHVLFPRTLKQFALRGFVVLSLLALFAPVYTYTRGQLQSVPVSAAVGINRQINFQGKLVNPNGTNVTDGSYSIVFSIYSVASAGSAIWTETQSVTVTNGIFQVDLGSITALPGSVDFNTDNIYLGIKVGADAEMTPRVRFSSVPQAFNAEKLGGLDKTGFVQNQNVSAQAAGLFIQATSGVTATIQGVAGQNIMEIKNSAGTTVSGFTSTGDLRVAGGIDTYTATTLAIGNSVATAVSLCNSATCDTIQIGTNADADAIQLGDATDTTTITGTLGVVGLATFNNNVNFATNINTGTNNTLVTIGGGAGTFSLQTSNIDVSSAGAISGATGFASTGVFAFTGGSNFSVDSSAFDVTTGGAVSGVTTLSMSGVLTSTLATGTAPLTVASTTVVTNLNADLLDGQSGAYYQDATNLNAGTVASARISGSYTGITGTGALNAGTITSGFGTIDNADTITGTTLNGTTGINTGAGAGTQRIDASGNLVNIGTYSGSGNITTTGGVLSVQGTGVNTLSGDLSVLGTVGGKNILPYHYASWEYGTNGDSIPNSKNSTVSSVTISNTVAYDGTKSVAITGDGSNTDGYAYLSSTSSTNYDISVKPSTRYILSVYARASVASASADIFARTNDASNTHYGAAGTVNNTGWTRVYRQFTTASDATKMLIRADNNTASSTVYFDGFMLEEVPSTQSIPSYWSPSNAAYGMKTDATGNFQFDGSIATGTTVRLTAAGVLQNVTSADASTFFTGGTLGVARGGTGVASYAIGDTLYASGATTLSKLAAVASGSCLISNGVGVAPSWGSCATGGGITGAGTSGQVTYFNGADTVTSSANLLFNGTNLTVAGTTTAANFRTDPANTTYSQLTRNGGGSALYVNQVDAVSSILALSSGTATAGSNIVLSVANNGALTSSSTVQGTRLISTIATGTAPLTVASTTLVSNFNADLLDGQSGAFYQDATNLNAGTLSDARLSSTVHIDRGAASSAADWNTYTTQGTYRVGAASWTGTNQPTSAYSFGTLVVDTSGNSTTQTYYTHNGTGAWTRTKWNAADWSAWQKMYTDTNDGSGSGLDADLLDGQSGSFYQDAANINAGTLAVARGGTGVASYTIGDMLYASGATTLSKLAAVASGSCLISNGVGVAPSWGACDGAGLALQASYTASTGGTTPEIKLDATRAGLDIQDANTTIAGDLLTVRGSNAGGLGTRMFSVSSTGSTTVQSSNASALQVQTTAGADVFNVDTTYINGNLVTNPSVEVNTTGWNQRTGTTLTRTTTSGNYYYGVAGAQAVVTATIGAGINYPVQLPANTAHTISAMVKLTSNDGNKLSVGYAADGATETTYVNVDAYDGNAGTGWFNVLINFTTPASVSPGAYFFIKQNSAVARTMYIDGIRAENSFNGYSYIENLIKLGDSATSVLVGGAPGAIPARLDATMFVQQTHTNRGLVVRATPQNQYSSGQRVFDVVDASDNYILTVDTALGSGVFINGGNSFWGRAALSVTASGGPVAISTNGRIEVNDIGAAGTELIRVGDDAFLTDIDVGNTLGLYGVSNSTVGSLKLGSGGVTLTGSAGVLSVSGGGAEGAITVQGTTAGSQRINFESSGSIRWAAGGIGGGVNPNFEVQRYTGGTYQNSPLVVSNSSGLVTLNNGLTINGGISQSGGDFQLAGAGTIDVSAARVASAGANLYLQSGNGNNIYFRNATAGIIGTMNTSTSSLQMNGNITANGSVTGSTMYTGNWFRSTGDTGWHNDTYGGGWQMIDSSWIRSYAKAVYMENGYDSGAGDSGVGCGGGGGAGAKLRVCGNFSSTGQVRVGVWGAASAATVCRTGAGDLATCSSSQRYKHNIQTANWGMDAIRQMRAVTFNWNEDGRSDFGFIAEEMNQINPLFAYEHNGQIEGVDYMLLTSVLASGIQNVDSRVLDIESALNNGLTLPSLTVTGVATVGALAVTGDAIIQGNVTVLGDIETRNLTVNGHIVTAGNAPVAAVGVAAGQPSQNESDPAVMVDGNDSAGSVSITTGSQNLANGVLAHISFAEAFSGSYKVVISASNDQAGLIRVHTVKTATGFDIVANDTAGALTQYVFDYIVLGAQMNP